MARRVCPVPGCPVLTDGGRCDTHRDHDRHGGVRRQDRGHGADYDRLARQMRDLPCELRLPGCTGTATGADLIIPRSRGGLAVPQNARPACAHCQSVQGGQMSRPATYSVDCYGAAPGSGRRFDCRVRAGWMDRATALWQLRDLLRQVAHLHVWWAAQEPETFGWWLHDA